MLQTPKIRPLFDKIVVKPITRIKSDILQVVMDEVDNMGVVVAVGPGKMDDWGRFTPNPLKGGEFVRFGTMKHTKDDEYLKFTNYYEDGERYLIMSWQDICMVMDSEE